MADWRLCARTAGWSVPAVTAPHLDEQIFHSSFPVSSQQGCILPSSVFLCLQRGDWTFTLSFPLTSNRFLKGHCLELFAGSGGMNSVPLSPDLPVGRMCIFLGCQPDFPFPLAFRDFSPPHAHFTLELVIIIFPAHTPVIKNNSVSMPGPSAGTSCGFV